jgi:hypothetical protein
MCLRLSSKEQNMSAKGYEGTVSIGLRFIHDKSLEKQVSALSHEFGHVLGQHQSITTHYPKMLEESDYAQKAISGIETSKSNAKVLIEFYKTKIIDTNNSEKYTPTLDFAKAIFHKARYLLGEVSTIYEPQYDLFSSASFPDIEEIRDRLSKEKWLPGALAGEDTTSDIQSWQEDEANRTGLRLVVTLGILPMEYARQLTDGIFSLDPDFASFEECVDKIQNGTVPVWRNIYSYPTPCRMVYNIFMEAKRLENSPSREVGLDVKQALAELRILLTSAQKEIKTKMPTALSK